MSKFITHVHTIYSTDGWNNPDCIRRYAENKDVFVELLTHNSLLWTRLYPEVFKSEHIIPAVEFGFKNTDVIAAGKNLDELIKDKRFPIFDHKVGRWLNISLDEGIEILREKGAEYIYFPHPTAPVAGAVKNGYEHLIKKVDGVEVWNGSISLFPPYNMSALNLAEKYNKTKFAGIDGHLGTISLKSCYNLTEAQSKDEIYEAVRKNRLEPHKNPFYPILLAKDYGVLAFLTLRGLLDKNSEVNPSNSLSLTEQLY